MIQQVKMAAYAILTFSIRSVSQLVASMVAYSILIFGTICVLHKRTFLLFSRKLTPARKSNRPAVMKEKLQYFKYHYRLRMSRATRVLLKDL